MNPISANSQAVAHVLRCVHCGKTQETADRMFRCTECSELLEVVYPEWAHAPQGFALRLKEIWRERRGSALPENASGVWRFRELLPQIERENIVTHGYGLHSFAHALVGCFERLSADPVTPQLHATIQSFAHAIADHPVEFLPDVPETVDYLSSRHHLILMTKGAFAEQSGKVERSGLKEYFEAVEIVPEKDEAVYRSIIAKYELSNDTTWMIGNSPKSDINPALSAGINAVFVPHGATWILEHDEVAEPIPPSRLITVESFVKLREHF